MEFHTPVLLQEVIKGLNVQPGKKYIDATLGGGGHAFEILKRGGKVLGIDVDEEAIEYVKSRIQSANWRIRIGKDVVLIRGNFRDVSEIAKEHGFDSVAGVLFDLGVSSHQLKTQERGFSFQEDAPLDMRMDKTLTIKASDLVNGLYENELARLFEKLGEEKWALGIARAICRARALRRIETTGELAQIIESVKKAKARVHPATKVFQALRIAVNDELGSLEKALPQALELIENRGRIAVISFHSLEDRIVKHFFGKHALTKKPIVATNEEITQNPRARSAKLRVYEKN